MKNKKQKNNKKIFIALLIILLVVAGIVFLAKAFFPTTKTYHSKFLKITIDYPAKYSLEEKFTNIILTDSREKIVISRTGTNFEKLEDHINNLSELNRFTITDKQNITINDSPAIKGFIDNKGYYFVYSTAWTVFSLSTDSSVLYSDLDQIAHSFRYEP